MTLMLIIVDNWQDVLDVSKAFDGDPCFWPSGAKRWDGRYEVKLYKKYPLCKGGVR